MNEHTPLEKELLKDIANAVVVEQRRARRWGIFFKLLTFFYLFLLLGLYVDNVKTSTEDSDESYTALVKLDGIIADDTEASADNMIKGLRNAFEAENAKGVILRINSPGGSPVQSAYINDEIHRLRKQYPDKPLYAVVTDLCASGGYYIAAAADEIYVNRSSIIGSIGVLMSGFGFVEAMDKLGIERRLLTAGKNKAMLDPFSPFKPEESQHIHSLLTELHQHFMDTVKKGRKKRLADDPDLFTGMIWTGETAIKLGLADKLGNSSDVARDVIKAEKIVDFTPKDTYLDRLAERFGTSMAQYFSQQFKSQPQF